MKKMNNKDTISIREMISLLNDMFSLDDGANRALEAHSRGEVPYEEYELLRMECDEIWDILKENVRNFKSLCCEDCIVFNDCNNKSKYYINEFCSNFKVKRNKILDNGFRVPDIDSELCNYAVDETDYTNVIVKG
jgi:hypothetical protein